MEKSHKKNEEFSPVPAVYLHIPFCREICPFCSFAVCKDHTDLHSKYITEMLKEISMIVEGIKGKKQKGSELQKSNGQHNYGKYKGSANNHHFVIENVIESLQGGQTKYATPEQCLKVIAFIEQAYKNRKVKSTII